MSVQSIIFGANGSVGRALMEYLSDSVGTYRNARDNLVEDRKYEYVDITNTGSLRFMFEQYRPKRVFIAAANAHVDECEKSNTDRVNVDGIRSIINNCYSFGTQVIFFSSSYVFDGESQTPYKPKDATFPINAYGRQKEKIEKLLLSFDNLDWLIIRTVGVFGREGTPTNFVSQVASAIKKGSKIIAPIDQTMNPIWSMDLARVVIKLSDRFTNEIFHVSGNECLSKYDFAIKVAYMLGCKKPHDIVVGVKSEDMKQIAVRPKNGCLDCDHLVRYAVKTPSFEKGLKKYLS